MLKDIVYSSGELEFHLFFFKKILFSLFDTENVRARTSRGAAEAEGEADSPLSKDLRPLGS